MNSNTPTLYDRLGGVYAIATVVDDFIDRVMSNPILNANPAVDEAHHRVSPAGFKYLVMEMVCWALGGPQQYSGRAMRESHEQLKILRRSGPLSARISMTPWPSLAFPTPRRTNLGRRSDLRCRLLQGVNAGP
jgi:truncated hemoglobin YjbI